MADAEFDQFFDLLGLFSCCRLLDCGGGPSSFAVEYARRGYEAVSRDSLFKHGPRDIQARFDATVGPMTEGMVRARDRFLWH